MEMKNSQGVERKSNRSGRPGWIWLTFCGFPAATRSAAFASALRCVAHAQRVCC
ncbi:hypothetical protein ASPWEDRAFT_43738 [Aspergillus wentii DTO 134E9]|uniref:Uncharacterized protein n=1 Tax=Aspergillus wentii DTO 134E9 TaxID=1073089 RepID=A0A1L9RA28_ASPWE|nr:uncharacterized protein ASPWEDRAFT_43738 [Aspergillus wentii DTO 134E9]OJJ31759.1 hypothetical protein ASPWEDRAFT_43738 [Aspergillus wentii DTO 134E9]